MPVVTETEQELLHRIARRNGFSEKDLEGKSSEHLSYLIAARDKGHFCNSLKDRTFEELQMLLSMNKSDARFWLMANALDSRV
jgi:hypothetical protein